MQEDRKIQTISHIGLQKHYSVQMGTNNQKNMLIAETVKEIFSKTSNVMHCLYLFWLGKVKDLRKSLNISSNYDDEDDVYKFELTKDFIERTIKHLIQTFKVIKNINMFQCILISSNINTL